MISKSTNIKQLKSPIVSLFRSSSSVNLSSTTNSSITKPYLLTPPNTLLLPLFSSKVLTSKQSLFSNSFSITRVIHSGGARNLCSISSFPPTECEVNYQASSSSSEVNGPTQNIKRKNLWTLWTSVPVRAYCLSHRIDLMGLMTENQANLIPHTPGIGNYVVLRFGDITVSRSPPLPPRDSYMVVFKYGSTVMFNMLDHEVDGYLKIIKKHASGMLPETTKDGGDSSQKYIDCELREKLKLPACMQGGLNHMMLQNFNIDGICTVASVFGQSVALDYYSRLVHEWISEYVNVNIGLEESGILCSTKRLVELAQRTSGDADIVYSFGLSERSDVTWKEDSEYSHMFDYLRDEFKLTQRFADLDRQFKMGELNIWFTVVEMVIPQAVGRVAACIICIALLLCLPVVILPISAVETYLMSI